MAGNDKDFTLLQQTLGYRFNDPGLLSTALTHSSYANENKDETVCSNERLEFLGDSVLGMAVAEAIYEMKPLLAEGKMTRLRAELVCERNLTMIAKELRLGDYIALGKGEDRGGGRERPSILADAVESVLAAVYIDGGLGPVEAFIDKHFVPQIARYEESSTDYKTILQELVQEKQGQKLSYHTVGESGPEHMKSFSVEVRLNGAQIGFGSGGSKKEAEQAAAKSALESS